MNEKKAAADVLLNDILSLMREADSINEKNPFSAYPALKKMREQKEKLRRRLDELHDQYQKSLTVNVTGLGFESLLTTRAGVGLSAVLQVEREFQSVGATLDRKGAFTFGYIALYVALVSLVISVVS